MALAASPSMLQAAVDKGTQVFQKFIGSKEYNTRLREGVCSILDRVAPTSVRSQFVKDMISKLERDFPTLASEALSPGMELAFSACSEVLVAHGVNSQVVDAYRAKLGEYQKDVQKAILAEQATHFNDIVLRRALGMAAGGIGGLVMGQMMGSATVGFGIGILVGGTVAAATAANYYLNYDPGQVRREFATSVQSGVTDDAMRTALVARFQRGLTAALQGASLAVAASPPAAVPAPPALSRQSTATLTWTDGGFYEAIIWHDPNIDSTENQGYLGMLREKYPGIAGFADHQEAAQHVKRNPILSFTVMTSGTRGKELVASIHHLPQVKQVLVFCSNVDWHRGWAQTYSKVGRSRVYDEIDPVLRTLAQPAPAVYHDIVSAKAFSVESAQAFTAFAFSLLSDDYFQMTMRECVEKFAQLRREHHHAKDDYADWRPESVAQLTRHLEEPRQHCEKLLRLYTSEEEHVYDTMNAKLMIKWRDRDLLMVCKIAESFLNAMHAFQQQGKPDTIFWGTVFRGYWVADSEADKYLRLAGGEEFFVFRSFASTSTSEAAARGMAELRWTAKQEAGKEGKKVLFEIECPTVLHNYDARHPNAGSAPWIWPLRLSSVSEYADEAEVLLPLQALVRVRDVRTEADGFIHVRGTLVVTSMEWLAPFIFCLL